MMGHGLLRSTLRLMLALIRMRCAMRDDRQTLACARSCAASAPSNSTLDSRQTDRPSVRSNTLLVAVIESCAAASLSFCFGRDAKRFCLSVRSFSGFVLFVARSHRNRRPALWRLHSAIASCLLCTRQIDGRIGTSRRGRLVVAPAVSLQLAKSQWWRWRWW